jgi:LPXTG-site transpeptidase (sortase) family protein
VLGLERQKGLRQCGALPFKKHMQPKTSLKRLMLVVSITGVVFSLAAVFFLTFYLPGRVYYYFMTLQYDAGLPIRLEIPKIKVNATIIPVGVAKNGSMEAPSGPKDVGWLKFGSRPGNSGSAVIAGHYGYWKKGVGSVFDDLNKLRKGDKLYVEDERGVIITFVVRKILTYDQNEDASSIFNSSDGKAHLNLITCEGDWNSAQETYSNRLVIFTDKE